MEHGDLAKALPALAEAARTVGSPQIRAAGSIGGNLGTCSPAGDSLPVLSALNAIVHLQSEKSTRSVSFSEFMWGRREILDNPMRSSRASPFLLVTVGKDTQKSEYETQWSFQLPQCALLFMMARFE
jgi:CO/xanthine dehydrogenase FAD-binding subunit